MDKLELDDRVSRLERRVSFLMVLLPTVVLLALAAALLMTSRLETPQSPAVMSPSETKVEIKTFQKSRSPAVLGEIDGELRKLRDLQLQALITPNDFEAKKAVILERPLNVGDYAKDIQTAMALRNAGFITPSEYDALKNRILAIGD
jgi:hypothetical protein